MNEIAIVGGGISGTLTYLFLKKYLSPVLPEVRIRIYEKHNAPVYHRRPHQEHLQRVYQPLFLDSTDAVSGAVEIAANGVRCLKELDPGILKTIKRFGHQFKEYGICSASGNVLKTRRIGTDDQNIESIFIMRADLLDILLPCVSKEDIHYGLNVAPNREPSGSAHSHRLQVYFEKDVESHSMKADLIIGADGADSVIRKRLLSEAELIKTECITVGAFFDERTTRTALSLERDARIPSPNLSVTKTSFGRIHVIIDKFTFNQSRPQTEWHESENPNRNFPFAGWWCTINTRHLKDIPESELKFPRVKDEILKRLERENGLNPLLSSLVAASGCTFKSLGPSVRDRRKDGTFMRRHMKQQELDRYWGYGGRLVVVGDAAHSMPVETTQGISLAIEDARSLAMLLKQKFTALHDSTRKYPIEYPLLAEEYKKKVMATLVIATTAYSKISYARYKCIMSWTKTKCPRCRVWPVIESMFRKSCDQGRFCEKAIKRLWSYRVENAVEKACAGEHQSLFPTPRGAFDTIGRSLRVCGSLNPNRKSIRSKHDSLMISGTEKSTPAAQSDSTDTENKDIRPSTFGRAMGHKSYRQYCLELGYTPLRAPLYSSTFAPQEQAVDLPPDSTAFNSSLEDASNSRTVSGTNRQKGKGKETDQDIQGIENMHQNQNASTQESVASSLKSQLFPRDSYGAESLASMLESSPPGLPPIGASDIPVAGPSRYRNLPRPDSSTIPIPPIILTNPTDENAQREETDNESTCVDEQEEGKCTHGLAPPGPTTIV